MLAGSWNEEFLSNLPQITDAQKALADIEISISEIKFVLRENKDSTLGPDGLLYSIYKMFPDQLIPLLFESWNEGIAKGELSAEQCFSYITLIPKAGKDFSQLNNLQPISLSNTDI